MNDSAYCQAHERVWLRNVQSEVPGDTRTCSGENDPYDLWADSTVPEGPAAPSPAPGGERTSTAATVHARSAAGTLALLLLPVIGVLV